MDWTKSRVHLEKKLDIGRGEHGAFSCIKWMNILFAFSTAGEAKSTSAEVDITVSDANDNPPFFRAMPHSVFISESALPNTPVYTLIADDPDVGINKAFTYAGNSPEGQFAVDAHTGVITTVGRLDFEKQQK